MYFFKFQFLFPKIRAKNQVILLLVIRMVNEKNNSVITPTIINAGHIVSSGLFIEEKINKPVTESIKKSINIASCQYMSFYMIEQRVVRF